MSLRVGSAMMSTPAEMNTLAKTLPMRGQSEFVCMSGSSNLSFQDGLSARRKKYKTPASKAKYREKVWSTVDAEALAEMHCLNSEARRPSKQGMTVADMQTVWERCPGSWSALGEPPKNFCGMTASSEVAFSRRSVKISPPTKQQPEDLLGSCGVWVENLKGMKSSTDRTIGQDNFCIALLDSGWELYAVCDGHGENGHWPAMRAAQTLPLFMQSGDCATMIKQGRMDAALIRAFHQVEQDLELVSRAEGTCNLFSCGCTCVCMLRHPAEQSLWLGHVGDSRAILVRKDGSVAAQTQDHKPTVPAECERLEAGGCEVRKQEYEDGLTEQRIFIKGKKFPGIMMTRSLGDTVLKKRGLIATPEVVEWPLEGNEGAVVVLASDGIWEFLESEEAASVVAKRGEELRTGAQQLVTFAQDLWESKEPGYCDDCTALLVDLAGPGLRPLQRAGGSKSETCCASGCSLQ